MSKTLKTRLALAAFAAALLAAPLLYLAWCTTMPGESSGGARALDPLEEDLSGRLEQHVRTLCELSPRSDSRPSNYRTSAAYIRDELAEYGLDVIDVPIASEQNIAHARAGSPLDGTQGVNLLATPKQMSSWDDLVVVGAHYDTYLERTPGADDNASGVAAALELARLMAGEPGAERVVFAFFANEEPPHFQRSTMGSLSLAAHLVERGATVRIMFSLEMLGFYSDEPGSQNYPPVLASFYPDTADFVGFVTRTKDRALLTRTIEAWRSEVDFPSEGFAGPSWVTGVDFSDHWSFWRHDFPAIMITDTAFFRNPHYHKPTDTPETLDFARFARVTVGVRRIVEMWAQESGA